MAYGMSVKQTEKYVLQLAELLKIDPADVRKANDTITRRELLRIARNDKEVTNEQQTI